MEMRDNWREDPGMLGGGRGTIPGKGVDDRLNGMMGTPPKVFPLLHHRTSRHIPTTTNADQIIIMYEAAIIIIRVR